MGKKKRRRRSEDSSSDDSAPSRPQISADDYYQKASEFRVWLLHKKKIYMEDLPTDKAKEMFARKFVKRWNAGRLSRRYYDGIAPEEVQAAGRTKHTWKLLLTPDDEKAREAARSSILADTTQRSFVDTRRADGARVSMPVDWPAPPPPLAATAAAPAMSSGDARLMEETEREAQRDRDKWERRKFNDQRKDVEEELVPKKEGREARIEKRQMKGPNKPSDGGGDMMEMSDKDAFGGGGNDFQRRLAAEKARNAKRVQAKQELAQAALKDYAAKEEAKLAPFRAMLAAGNIPLMQSRFSSAGPSAPGGQ
eukprot:TRINITY_DN19267_c0_g1_i1.p1 TRINITY_DN19267_c0_g1~~TRINITY_DN19267_c0_g1_i1.p1  ORF type:complete len:340 (-),score=75.58 TRINITY_DN19267_c0_g1_i1:271-1197(-)